MKRLFSILLSFVLYFSGFSQVHNPILDWESLPLIRKGVKIKAYSSTNPTGRTMRDFRNHTLYSGAGHEMIRLHQDRGMLVHLWFTSLGGGDNRFGTGRFGRINFYFSNEESPAYIKDRDLYFRRPALSFPTPLWDTDGQAQWAFPCLPFRDFFMVSSSQNPHWFQITTHLYRNEISDESIPEDVLYQISNKLRDYRGRYPGKERGNRMIDKNIEIGSGSVRELFNWNNPGVIRTITMIPSTLSNEIIDNTWIRIDYGQVEKNAIEVPLSVFFGGYVGAPVTNALGLPAGYDGREFYFHFPMPFWERITFTIINRSRHPVSIDYTIRYSDTNTYDPGLSGKFYIQYNNNISLEAGKPDFIHLGKEGSGMIVGTVANLAGSIEGNFRLYVDGSKTPAVETTGGEDYFCHAFGIDVGLCTPFHGGLFDKIGYRFHIIDYMPFLSSVTLGQDHGHEYMHDRDGIFRSAVFYYWNPEKKIILTDSLDPGNKSDEKKHDYTVFTRSSNSREDHGRYEGNYNKDFSDTGTWFDELMSFNVKIDPDNEGVRLRRRINQLSFHQLMDVYVDGKYAGKWFEQGSNYSLLQEPDPENYPRYSPDWAKIKAIWRDTEFEIPVSFTKNKKQIRIELKPISARSAIGKSGESQCNAYFFWVYSYVE